ncbi:hypothetical protein GCM10011505_23650 [Tistrella bauzanensis]|uniref:Glycosyltransferase n=1 Tax=Tistrella bauzanensis TaxID=657419 RepID=A0ABQ1IIU7_9PROT|nr:glycosyltransferase family 4 protein [Tistrella bauzanensis]GGB41481.1 hypothetical protein GCM10011505_23650 [Tistrella bauzanensis]
MLMTSLAGDGLSDASSGTMDRQRDYARAAGAAVEIVALTSPARAVAAAAAGDAVADAAGRVRVIPVAGASMLRAVPGLIRVARARAAVFQPALIYTQDPFFSGLAGLAASRAAPGAVLLVGNHSTIFSGDRWIAEKPARNCLLKRLAAHVFRHADAARVVNVDEAAALALACDLEPARIDAIPMPFAIEPFARPVDSAERIRARAMLGAGPDDPLLLWVGRPVPFKRLPVVIDAAGKVLRARPDARFAMVGDRRLAREDLDAMITATGAADRITWLDQGLPHDALPAVFAAADVFLMGSHYEGFGGVLVEAAAAGLPAVSTAADGPRAVIEDGVTGWLVPVDDAAALAHNTLVLLADPEMRVRMGATARARALDRFGYRATLDRVVESWQRQLALGHRNRS